MNSLSAVVFARALSLFYPGERLWIPSQQQLYGCRWKVPPPLNPLFFFSFITFFFHFLYTLCSRRVPTSATAAPGFFYGPAGRTAVRVQHTCCFFSLHYSTVCRSLARTVGWKSRKIERQIFGLGPSAAVVIAIISARASEHGRKESRW